MATKTVELDAAPGTLGLLARAAVPMLPLASRLPFVAGGSGELPDVELVLREARADRDAVAAYARVCGFPLRDTLPATYPHVLAFPLQLALMTDARFPFPAIGLVHVANEITQHRPVGAAESLTLTVRATDLEPHPRGRTFALRTEGRAREELVWEERSTMLRRGRSDAGASGSAGAGGSAGASDAARETAAGDAEPPSLGEPDGLGEGGAVTWRLPGDLGRRYAGVSGDRNPIHMHDLTAKAFGFPRAIAHGMWTLARSLAALDARAPDAFMIDARFRKPILLPATVELATDGQRFEVRDARKATPHLDGTITTKEST